MVVIRILQLLRARLNLNAEEVEMLMPAISGLLLNEAAYAIGGAMLNGYKLTEILPPQTIKLLEDMIKGIAPDILKCDEVDATLGHFKEFVREEGSNFPENLD